jgi:hypothetical protein
MAFEQADAGVEGERHRVRYGLVRLLDRPDQIAGSTIDSLDAGDEVAILEVSGLYRRVVTPDGRTGWLHKMTLGDVVPAPLAGDDAQVDPDVLVAYLAARGRV